MEKFNYISNLMKKLANLEASSLAIRTAVFSGPIIVAFAIFLGFDVLQLSSVVLLMSLSRYLDRFGVKLAKKVSDKKRFGFGFMSIAVLLTGFLPFLPSIQDPAVRFLLFLVIMVFRSGFYNIGRVVYCDWIGSQANHPQGIRLLKNRTKVLLISSITALFIGALIIQTLPDIAEKIPLIGPIFVYNGTQVSAFAAVFWSAMIIVLVGFVPQVALTDKNVYEIKESTGKPLFEVLFSKENVLLSIFTVAISAGFYSVSELFHFHAQKNLTITLIFSAILMIFTLLAGFFTKNSWGYLADRFGMKPVLRLICLLGAFIIPISSFLATTQTPAFLIITAVAIGGCVSGINAILPTKFPMKLVPTDKQSELLAVVSSLIGFGGSLGIAIAGLTMHFAGQSVLPTFLGIQVLPYHFTGIEGAIFFLIAFFIGYKITEPGAARLRDLVMYLIRRAIRLGKKEENIATNKEFEKEKDGSTDNSKEE